MATRALVLGGGGLVGVAWESGLLAGLSESRVDLARADFIVGTSAGSFVGAQVAVGRSASSIVDATLAADPAQLLSAGGRPIKVPDMSVLFAKMGEAVSGARPAEQVRAEIGAWALSAETILSEKEFIARFGRSFSRFPEDFWPKRPYACTAVDAADGSFVLCNKDSQAGLVDAVASSCAAPGVFPPITIRGRRYIDGGMRSPTNALLGGQRAAVVLLPDTRPPVIIELKILDEQTGVEAVQTDYRKIQELQKLGAVEGFVSALICDTGTRKSVASLVSDIKRKLGKTVVAGELRESPAGWNWCFACVAVG